MINPYATQVEAGAAWLDKYKPDWVEAFAGGVLDGLDMANCNNCVLGHVFGSYYNAPVIQELNQEQEYGALNRFAAAHGFSLGDVDGPDRRRCWQQLGEAWKDYINKRMANEGLLAGEVR